MATAENDYHLTRFIDAQESAYPIALAEIKKGLKKSHWIWYIFPQIQGLAPSNTSKYYAIQNIREAESFLHHPVLGRRLIEISKALLQLKENNATIIMGTPDDLKLKSSMTLFASLPKTNSVFQAVLDKFYRGKMDIKTLEIIGKQL
jgi:uncharacterized protein (DUF1810 family)